MIAKNTKSAFPDDIFEDPFFPTELILSLEGKLENYELLKGMYEDPFFPTHLVDKLKDLFIDLIAYLETGENDLTKIQAKLDEFTLKTNDLSDEFEDNDSEMDTTARENIGEALCVILYHFNINIEFEESTRLSTW